MEFADYFQRDLETNYRLVSQLAAFVASTITRTNLKAGVRDRGIGRAGDQNITFGIIHRRVARPDLFKRSGNDIRSSHQSWLRTVVF